MKDTQASDDVEPAATAPALKRIGELIRKLDRVETTSNTTPGGNS